jgi:hypothetical protein
VGARDCLDEVTKKNIPVFAENRIPVFKPATSHVTNSAALNVMSTYLYELQLQHCLCPKKILIVKYLH